MTAAEIEAGAKALAARQGYNWEVQDNEVRWVWRKDAEAVLRAAYDIWSVTEQEEADVLIREWSGKLPGLAARWIDYREGWTIHDRDDAEFIRAFGPKTIVILFNKIRAAGEAR